MGEVYSALDPEHRHAVRGNLSLLSLLDAVPGMPDPAPHRARVAELLTQLEGIP